MPTSSPVGLTVTKFMVPSEVMCEKDFFISKIVLGRYLSNRSDSHLMGTSTSCRIRCRTKRLRNTCLHLYLLCAGHMSCSSK